jgi:hypothetical protein
VKRFDREGGYGGGAENVFVDTCVWSLALRRDAPAGSAEVAFLECTVARAFPEGL